MELKIEEIDSLNNTIKGKDGRIQELLDKLKEMNTRCDS